MTRSPQITRIFLDAGAFLVALCAGAVTLLICLSRIANAPPGTETGWWAFVLAATVGSVGMMLVPFRIRAAFITLALTVVLTSTIIVPESGLPTALYAGSAVLALASYLADRTPGTRGGRSARA